MSDDWDQAADAFDEEPDHGLRDPQVRQAWIDLLRQWLPTATSRILDAGCGTGSLSLVLADLGHDVIGIDRSPRMIERAQAKAAGRSIRFEVMDAAAPPFEPESFDVIVCRHVLWIFETPAEVLQRWALLLKPGARWLLMEGYWHTGVGLHAAQVVAALPSSMTLIAVQNLSEQPQYWGKTVTDERYLLIADRHS